MNNLSPLELGHYYHIYNRSNGNENLFQRDKDYHRFLSLYSKYITPIAETIAWVLMPNHFHLLVLIKKDIIYKYSKESFSSLSLNFKASQNNSEGRARAPKFDDLKWETIPSSKLKDREEKGLVGSSSSTSKIPNPTRHFAHLCNSYTKYINLEYARNGSLFQRRFRRKCIEDERYLKQLVLYIHNNPVNHGFTEGTELYPWSSYHAYLGRKSIDVACDLVYELFGDVNNLKVAHQEYANVESMSNWLEVD